MISIIAAVARNRAIGFENKLIYRLPNDLKRFKQLTTGHTIVMGRNTFLSLPKGALPNRRNIVLTRKGVNKEFQEVREEIRDNTTLEFFGSLDVALRHCDADEDIYIIGGASVYRQAMSVADRLCLTEIDDTPAQADTYFPDYSDWHEVSREVHETDERHAYRYAFVDYEKGA